MPPGTELLAGGGTRMKLKINLLYAAGIALLIGSASAGDGFNAILPNYWDRVSAQFNGVGCTLEKA